MRILHLTDLHYGEKYASRIERMLPSLLKILSETSNDKKIDFIVFSGDLVYSGAKKSSFNDAYNKFINEICKKINIAEENVIICAGNHDMESGKELQAIVEYVDKINNNDNLDNFVEKDSEQFPLSCENSKNYLNFITKKYSGDHIDKLHQVFIRELGEIKIGFVSFNSAWRSFIGDHSGKLLIPRYVLLKALKRVSHCDLKISLIHHPLEDLKMFNKYEIEDSLFESFHINFSGHYHKRRHAIHLSFGRGMLSLSSAATMSGDDDSTIGFTILDIDNEINEGHLFNYTYSKRDNIFTLTSNNSIEIPVNIEKKKQIEFIKEVRRSYSRVQSEANDLLIYSETERATKTFDDLYTELLIKDKSVTEASKDPKKVRSITFLEIIEKNFIIYGREKSGKTSLLKKIELHLLKNYLNLGIIPVHFDLGKGAVGGEFDLNNYLRLEFNLSVGDAASLISTANFKVLIDNFNPDNNSHKNNLEYLEKNIKNVSFLIISQETQTSYFDEIKVEKIILNKAFIHPISRSCIRSQANKILYDFSEEDRQSVIEKIISIFSQLNIPYNFWSLSIFLWLYKKNKKLIFNDNVELVSLYIDKLLGREDIANDEKDIDYQLLMRFLGRLSKEMISKYQSKYYALTIVELSQFIEDFRDNNLRFIIDTHDLINYLLKRGVLKKDPKVSTFSFRLNGVMEYFTAVYMHENEKYVEELISNDAYYLEFANELELLAGLSKSNKNLLTSISLKTKKTLSKTNSKYTDNPDIILRQIIRGSKSFSKNLMNLSITENSSINLEKQDDIFDGISPLDTFDGDVKVKIPVNFESGFSHSQLEKHLLILSRVFRSLSLIEDQNLINETFDFIVDSYINLGFELVNEINDFHGKTEKQTDEFFRKFLTLFMPVIVQMALSDGILQNNLRRVVMSKIEMLEQNANKNEYKLMLLYFLILDLDVKSNRDIINKIIDNISINSLLNVSFVKIFYYLLFKANNSSPLQDFLKEALIRLKTKIDPKMDKGTLKQNLDKDLLLVRRSYM